MKSACYCTFFNAKHYSALAIGNFSPCFEKKVVILGLIISKWLNNEYWPLLSYSCMFVLPFFNDWIRSHNIFCSYTSLHSLYSLHTSFGSIHNEKFPMDSCYWTLFSCTKHNIMHFKVSIYFIATVIFPRCGRTQNLVTAANRRQLNFCIVHLKRSGETSPTPPPIAINWMSISEQTSHNLTTIILPQIRIIVWRTRGRLDIISCKYFDIKYKTEE